MKTIYSYIWMPLSLLALVCNAAPVDTRSITPAHVRVVWLQDFSKGSRDVFAERNELKLVGFDSLDGKGVRTISDQLQNYSKPMMTPDGTQVIYSHRPSGTFHIINWDGSGARKLGKGIALDVREDPLTHAVWVYCGTKKGTGKGHSFSQIESIRLNDTRQRKLVWNQTSIDADNFMVSRDGKFAGTLHPWPNGGIAWLPNQRWEQFSRGCWPSMAPDESGTFMIFDGPHKNMTMFAPRHKPHVIPVDQAPGVNGYEVYHPRWSNHTRFMTMTGPFTGDGSAPGGNRIGGGGASVEVYIGRFDPSYRKIEKWLPLTKNRIGDFYPDMWVEGGEESSMAATWKGLKPRAHSIRDKTQVHIAAGSPLEKYYEQQPDWPGYTDALEFVWEDSKHGNQIILPDGSASRTCKLEAKKFARFEKHYEADVREGYLSGNASAKPLIAALKRSNTLAIEMTISPNTLGNKDTAVLMELSDNGKPLIELRTEGHNLILRLSTSNDPDASKKHKLGSLSVAPHHLLVSYGNNELECFVDGEKQVSMDGMDGTLSTWPDDGQLTFGASVEGKKDWKGTMEAIAVFSRVMHTKEARIRSALSHRRIDERAAPRQHVVEARLVELSPTPTPKAIAPYNRCLATYHYTVTKVIEGEHPGKELTVDHWVILDNTVLDVTRKQGSVYQLTLESLESHPQLKSERRVSELSIFDEIPEFIDVGHPTRLNSSK